MSEPKNNAAAVGDKKETVKFNVGGKLYEVSRSLLEDLHPKTVLARMASDTWQGDPESTIFVERDGDRFRCVLDYMRDGRVDLPPTVSKASVLRDLDYFGIEAEPGLVNDGCGVLESAEQVVRYQRQYRDELSKNAEERSKNNKERIYLQVSHDCISHLTTGGQALDFCLYEHSSGPHIENFEAKRSV